MSVLPYQDNDDPELKQGLVTQHAKLEKVQARVRELAQHLEYNMSDRPEELETAIAALEWIMLDTDTRVVAVENVARRAFHQRDEWADAYDQLYQEYMQLAAQLGLLEE